MCVWNQRNGSVLDYTLLLQRNNSTLNKLPCSIVYVAPLTIIVKSIDKCNGQNGQNCQCRQIESWKFIFV